MEDRHLSYFQSEWQLALQYQINFVRLFRNWAQLTSQSLRHGYISTARLSGTDPDDEELEELEELMHSTEHDLWTRAKKGVHDLVERVGFAGILLCASVSYSHLSLSTSYS